MVLPHGSAQSGEIPVFTVSCECLTGNSVFFGILKPMVRTTTYVLIEVTVFLHRYCLLAVRSNNLDLRSAATKQIYIFVYHFHNRNGCQWGADGQGYSWRERRRPTNRPERRPSTISLHLPVHQPILGRHTRTKCLQLQPQDLSFS